MEKLNKFIPLTKVEEQSDGTLFVYGEVTAERPDRDDEICQYATTSQFYKAYNEELSKATTNAGIEESIMPLREMHQLSAVGCGKSIDFLGEPKVIKMGFNVVDPTAILKVKKGVYTGFSQGGSYVRKWKAPWKNPETGVQKNYTWYIANPGEVSLVDSPCLPTAHFDYVKADGSKELRKFAVSESSHFSPADAELIAAALKKTLQEPVAVTNTESENLLKAALDRIAALETAAKAAQGATNMTQDELNKAAADLLEKAKGASAHLQAAANHAAKAHKCTKCADHMGKVAKALGYTEFNAAGEGPDPENHEGATHSEETAKALEAFGTALLAKVQEQIDAVAKTNDESLKNLITALVGGEGAAPVAKAAGVGDRALVVNPGGPAAGVTAPGPVAVTKAQDNTKAADTTDDKAMTAEEIKKAMQGDPVQRLRMAKMIRPASAEESNRIQASMSMAAVRR